VTEEFPDSVSQEALLAGHPDVTNEQEVEPPGSDEVRRLMRGPTLAVIAGALRKTYPDASSHVEDAVIEGVVSFLAKRKAGVEIENPAGWIRVTAKNYLLNKLEREIGRETTDENLSSFAESRGEPSLEDREMFQFIKGLVERWESRRLKVVTLLFLEAGYEGEPLSQMEAANYASDILGEDVPWTSIGQTRRRGLTRLKAEILTIAEETGFDPITGKETATA
jgi:DNA-directed RNA polymerase specialized sigma24 family protein